MTRSALSLKSLFLPLLLIMDGTGLARSRHEYGEGRVTGAQPSRRNPICSRDEDVLLLAWPSNFGQPIILEIEAPSTSPEIFYYGRRVAAGKWSDPSDPLWTSGWTGAHPPASLVRSWVGHPLAPPSPCLSTRLRQSGLDRSDKLTVDGLRSEGATPGKHNEFRVHLSKPVYNHEGTEAVVLMSIVGIKPGGGIWLYYFNKREGKWRISGKRGLVNS